MPIMSANVNPMMVGKTIFVCAVNQEGYIGLNGKPVWSNSHDRLRLRRLTTGHTVAYGRGTWEAMGCKPLPDRVNIVVSKTLPKSTPGVVVVRSVAEIKLAYEAHGQNLLYILGGGKLFESMIDQVDIILMTQADDNTIGDTKLGFMIDESKWMVTSALGITKDEGVSKATVQVFETLLADFNCVDPVQQEAAHAWFTGRFMPVLNHHRTGIAGEKPFRETLTGMYAACRQAVISGLLVPPRQTPPAEGEDITTNYLVQMFFSDVGRKDALRYRMYGFDEISPETVKVITRAEEAMMAAMDNPDGRVHSHTYITLQRKPLVG